jgi:hypothetical protein
VSSAAGDGSASAYTRGRRRPSRIVDAYESGRRSRTGGAHDGELAAAYVRVAQAVNAEGIPADLRNRLNDLKATMYALRHPD